VVVDECMGETSEKVDGKKDCADRDIDFWCWDTPGRRAWWKVWRTRVYLLLHDELLMMSNTVRVDVDHC
jgi:hypothetical protein